MKNFYMLKKIEESEVPCSEDFDEVGMYGVQQISKRVDENTIFICTDGTELEDDELCISLQVDDWEVTDE